MRRSQQWMSAAFPLLLLLALAGLTFWLKSAVELPEERADGRFRHDPDYIVNDFTARKLSPQGQLQYQLKASEMRHYPDNDVTDIIRPNFLWLTPDRPPVTAEALFAEIIGKGEQVLLREEVVIRRAASPTSAELVGYMPDLTILPDDGKAFTASPVELHQGISWIKGIGMNIDQHNATYTLNAKVSGVIEKGSHK